MTTDRLSEWDLLLLKEFPYRVVMSKTPGRPLWDRFDSACDWCYNNLVLDTYTWKGPCFFFKRSEDCLLFTLKYA